MHLLDAGADVAFVPDRLGHANIQNTMVYMRYTTVTRDAQTRQLFVSHRGDQLPQLLALSRLHTRPNPARILHFTPS